MMKIIVDGMGGDNAPMEIVKGAVEASERIDHKIVIVGKEELIYSELEKYDYDKEKISVVNATEVIENEDSPVKAVRRKPDSSMVVGLSLLAKGEGDLFVSAGNTGALMAGSLLVLGRIEGIDRPAITSIYPVLGKKPSLILDAGANADCKPINLLQFAVMGSLYMEKVLGRAKPLIGLVNIGVEEHKGNAVVKAAHELIANCKAINFAGNVEARDVPRGVVDVVVCDGFTGNVILKLTEGLGMTILRYMKHKFTEDTKSKLGAAMLKDKIKSMRGEFDYADYGGAPILGVKKAVIKMHGASEAKAVRNAIINGLPYAEENVVGIIEEACSELVDEINIKDEMI